MKAKMVGCMDCQILLMTLYERHLEGFGNDSAHHHTLYKINEVLMVLSPYQQQLYNQIKASGESSLVGTFSHGLSGEPSFSPYSAEKYREVVVQNMPQQQQIFARQQAYMKPEQQQPPMQTPQQQLTGLPPGVQFTGQIQHVKNISEQIPSKDVREFITNIQKTAAGINKQIEKPAGVVAGFIREVTTVPFTDMSVLDVVKPGDPLYYPALIVASPFAISSIKGGQPTGDYKYGEYSKAGEVVSKKIQNITKLNPDTFDYYAENIATKPEQRIAASMVAETIRHPESLPVAYVQGRLLTPVFGGVQKYFEKGLTSAARATGSVTLSKAAEKISPYILPSAMVGAYGLGVTEGGKEIGTPKMDINVGKTVVPSIVFAAGGYTPEIKSAISDRYKIIKENYNVNQQKILLENIAKQYRSPTNVIEAGASKQYLPKSKPDTRVFDKFTKLETDISGVSYKPTLKSQNPMIASTKNRFYNAEITDSVLGVPKIKPNTAIKNRVLELNLLEDQLQYVGSTKTKTVRSTKSKFLKEDLLQEPLPSIGKIKGTPSASTKDRFSKLEIPTDVVGYSKNIAYTTPKMLEEYYSGIPVTRAVTNIADVLLGEPKYGSIKFDENGIMLRYAEGKWVKTDPNTGFDLIEPSVKIPVGRAYISAIMKKNSPLSSWIDWNEEEVKQRKEEEQNVNVGTGYKRQTTQPVIIPTMIGTGIRQNVVQPVVTTGLFTRQPVVTVVTPEKKIKPPVVIQPPPPQTVSLPSIGLPIVSPSAGSGGSGRKRRRKKPHWELAGGAEPFEAASFVLGITRSTKSVKKSAVQVKKKIKKNDMSGLSSGMFTYRMETR